MDRRYQVFISSTYSDLVDERREVIQALLELDCIPAGMELFPAADEDAWTLIARVVDDCDYYVLIVRGRYGSVSVDGISSTEREYDYAVSKEIPVLAFVHADPDLIPSGKTEINEETRAKLDRFRTKVRKRLVKTYSSAHELGSAVSRSLIKTIKDHPGEGWVRGRHAVTPQLSEELSLLRAQVAEQELELRSQEQRSAAEEQPPDDLARGSDTFEVPFTIRSFDLSREYSEVREYSWDQLLILFGPSLLNEASENDMFLKLKVNVLV